MSVVPAYIGYEATTVPAPPVLAVLAARPLAPRHRKIRGPLYWLRDPGRAPVTKPANYRLGAKSNRNLVMDPKKSAQVPLVTV